MNSSGQVSLQPTKAQAAVVCWIIEIFREYWKGSYYADQIHRKNEHLEMPTEFYLISYADSATLVKSIADVRCTQRGAEGNICNTPS